MKLASLCYPRQFHQDVLMRRQDSPVLFLDLVRYWCQYGALLGQRIITQPLLLARYQMVNHCWYKL